MPNLVPPETPRMTEFLKAIKWLDNECAGMGQPASPDGVPTYDAPACAKIIAERLAASQQEVAELSAGFNAAIRKNGELQASLAVAQADSKRLDWLEAESAKRGILLDWEDEEKVQRRLYEPAEYDAPPEEKESLEGTWRVVTNTMTPDGTGLREAIDAASRPSETTTEGK